MKFYEYKAHEIFRKYGIPVPRGVLASTSAEITDPPLPCVVKAQVLIGGRGKAGGIKFAKTLDKAPDAAREILGLTIGPHTGRQGYPPEMLHIPPKRHFSLAIDPSPPR